MPSVERVNVPSDGVTWTKMDLVGDVERLEVPLALRRREHTASARPERLPVELETRLHAHQRLLTTQQQVPTVTVVARLALS